MVTDFTNLLFEQIHRFAKNIKNVNDGHLTQINQHKYAHTWYIPIDLHSHSGTGIGAHKHTPNNEKPFGLGNEEDNRHGHGDGYGTRLFRHT
jgi:hypothetical protein